MSSEQAKSRLIFGVGAFGVGALACALCYQQARRHRAASDEWVSAPAPDPVPCASSAKVGDSGTEDVLGRVNGFKNSKLDRLINGVADELGTGHRYDPKTGKVYNDNESPEEQVEAVVYETAEVTYAREHLILDEAAKIVRWVRATKLHEKLPHRHVSDKHLSEIANLLEDIAEYVEDFWRCSRDDPMADLLELPLMRHAALLAAGGEEVLMMVPCTEGSMNMEKGDEPKVKSQEEEDFELLGVEPGATKHEVLAAFRRQAFVIHVSGHCVDVPLFHRLNNACQRRVAYGTTKAHLAFTSKAPALAVHLLVGADPRESRYRENSAAILDALHRDRLLQKIDVLRNWGEVGGSITGLGQG